MLLIPGWESFSIKYQREYLFILSILKRRIYVDRICVVPDPVCVLDAFRLCPMSEVKLVILAQEPYKSNASGLAFSCKCMTPSLEVLRSWLNLKSIDTDLSSWARQGVLLINAALTVELKDNPISHSTLWESFVRGCLEICSARPYLCYMLLGDVAGSYSSSIKSGLIIKEKHPAYYAREKIFESKVDVFYDINRHLKSYNIDPIDFWCISNE